MSYDPTTDSGMVRLICTDTNPSEEMLSDAEITAYLALNDGNIRMAAADALDHIATNEVLVQKRIKLLDLSTDGPSEAKALHELAETQRRLAADGAEEPVVDWAENPVDVFSWREKRLKDAQRGLP